MICFLKQKKREFPLERVFNCLENTVFLEPGPAWLASWLLPQVPARPPPQVTASQAPLSTSRAPSWEDPELGLSWVTARVTQGWSWAWVSWVILARWSWPSGQACTSSWESWAAQGCQRVTTLERGDIPAPGMWVSPLGLPPGTLCLLWPWSCVHPLLEALARYPGRKEWEEGSCQKARVRSVTPAEDSVQRHSLIAVTLSVSGNHHSNVIGSLLYLSSDETRIF